MKLSRWALLAAPLALAGCGAFGSAMTAHTNVVARAAGKELSVEDAAQILASNPQITADPEVVRALADLWVDYTLLATAAAEDSTLAVLDMERFLGPQIEGMTISRFLERAAVADTSFTEAELLALWAAEGPGSQVRARHVLLRLPADPTPAQRDSVRALAVQIRDQARGGADFAQLARQHSADGSAQEGGDLGFFGRGQMVAPFEQAAFALEPGQISDVVESPFGYHVIKVEEKQSVPIGDQAVPFRGYMQQRAMGQAREALVDSVKKNANVQVQPGAVQLIKDMAERGDLDIGGRAAERAVVTYRGGEVTVGEVARSLQEVPSGTLAQVVEAPDEQITSFLDNQATAELLLAEARRRNMDLPKAAADSLRSQTLEQLQGLRRSTGFGQLRSAKGAQADQAIEQQVRQLLTEVVSGQRQLPPLGGLGYALRESYGAEVNAAAFQKVVEKFNEVRASQPPAPMPGQMPPGAMPPGAGMPMPPETEGAAAPPAPGQGT